MNTVTQYIVGENAPSTTEAYNGAIIPNHVGNMALEGFMADPLDQSSEVTLDTTMEPPVLHLKNALTKTLFGYTNEQTGNFVNYTHEMSHGMHIVSGTYDGQPGTVLELT